MKDVELPKYLDVLLILDTEQSTRSRIYKLLPRSKDYLTNALRYLLHKELIRIHKHPSDERTVIIELTPKGIDAQNMIIQLYNILGLRIINE